MRIFENGICRDMTEDEINALPVEVEQPRSVDEILAELESLKSELVQATESEVEQ